MKKNLQRKDLIKMEPLSQIFFVAKDFYKKDDVH
jgi:maltoporin